MDLSSGEESEANIKETAYFPQLYKNNKCLKFVIFVLFYYIMCYHVCKKQDCIHTFDSKGLGV